MNLDIDSAIFIGFLAINLILGLFFGRGVKTIREYAVGDRNFSTATITATIVATWIGGGFFSLTIAKTYSEGLRYIVLGLGKVVSFFIVSYIIVPRSGKLLGSFSIAEAMGNIYGKYIRVITAAFGLVRVVGAVAIQFKVSSTILGYFFGVDAIYSTLIAASIVIFYSAFGGIKAVAYTDIIQFSTFTVFIPILAMIMWGTLDNPYQVVETLNHNPFFDLNKLLPSNSYDLINYLALILLFIVPGVDPTIFQRISMSKNVKQAQRSFVIASFVFLAIALVTFWVAILLLSNDPNIPQNDLIIYITNKYPYIGLKGFLLAAIMAMVMSTADSYINSAAILFAHDICKPLNFKIAIHHELLISRISSIVIGVCAVIIALTAKDLFQIILGMASFYMPVVTMPLLIAIFGIYASQKAVIIGITAGFATNFISNLVGIDSPMLIILANFVSLTGIYISQYFLNNPNSELGAEKLLVPTSSKLEKRRKILNLIKSIKYFSLWNFSKNNLPKYDYIYSLFGLFCIISVFSTMYSIPKEIQLQQKQILEFVYHTVLISSFILLTYAIWPPTFKQEKFIIIAWNILVPYILIFAPTLLIIISNFGQFQLMIFMLNIIIISLILRWQVVILMVFPITFLSVQCYKWYVGAEELSSALSIGLQFKIMYMFLLISSVLIAFLKPKQEQQELTEEKNEHLNVQVEAKIREAEEALALKGEFIRNMTHEYHAPMTGVISMAESLQIGYERLNDEQRKQAIDIIVESAHNFKVFDENLATLHALGKPHYRLNKENIKFSELVYQRIQTCSRLYEKNKDDREFILNIADNITISADRNYMVQLLDNLIINSISYCKKGKINITLTIDDNSVLLTITDEGIGIPTRELLEIFNPFVVSSKTKTPAGGRGVGLAICQRILEVHDGTIKAESDGEKGAAFIVKLPL